MNTSPPASYQGRSSASCMVVARHLVLVELSQFSSCHRVRWPLVCMRHILSGNSQPRARLSNRLNSPHRCLPARLIVDASIANNFPADRSLRVFSSQNQRLHQFMTPQITLPRTISFSADLNPPVHLSPDSTMSSTKSGRRRRSSSIIYQEPPESLEQISDQSALPNLNSQWVNAKGG